MKIATTFKDGTIFQHFGHSEQFKIYEVEDTKIINTSIIDTKASGHGALAGLLKENNVDCLICGGIGAGAQQALAEAKIKIYGGVTGDADQAVTDLLSGRLVFDPDIKCNHHGEGHHHDNHGKGNCSSHK